MSKLYRLHEKLVQTIMFKGVKFEVIERSGVIWVGCAEYAVNNAAEPDVAAALRRFREELIDVPKHEIIHPDCSAALSIHYTCDDKPCGLMFAQESYSEKQDKRYDVYKSPASLFIRVQQSPDVEKLSGRQIEGPWELFSIIKEQVMPEYGYTLNADKVPEIEYYNHKDGVCYAYVPVAKTRKMKEV